MADGKEALKDHPMPNGQGAYLLFNWSYIASIKESLWSEM